MENAEPIQVLALFITTGSLTPVRLRRGPHWLAVKVVHSWSKREGRTLVRFFNASTGANLYTLSYAERDCLWRLHEISPL